ncbi:MAG: type II toxin-antitoxin system Phd/YefM family antitoxin [Gemmatimonadetes bacterium]|nr:type II toxin-antitoxin system Phd/YefM family antitoxin [Gemmatimonadota bacterium]
MGRANSGQYNDGPHSGPVHSPANPGRRRVGAGEFKATCLKLMDEVEETGEEIIITKRNRPVAKLVPAGREGLRPFVGRSRGMISARPEDLMAPIGEDWEVDADL